MSGPNEHAEVQYLGVPGVTQACVSAVAQILQAGERIASARILTASKGNSKEHCLLLRTQDGDSIVIPAGFASGYGGEGPSGFSFVLALLMSLDIPVDEIQIKASVQDEIDGGCLSAKTLETLENQPLNAFRSGLQYVNERDLEAKFDGTLWQRLNLFVPLGVVDPRLVDIAGDFLQRSPDQTLMIAFRRLEEDTRRRLASSDCGDPGSEVVGQKLFAKAFGGESSALSWPGVNRAEHQGRANLFIGAYMAYRNPRAHSEEQWEDNQELLREFFLVNHLFSLLRTAKPRTELPHTDPGDILNEG